MTNIVRAAVILPYPLRKIVTHRYPVEQTEAALRHSMTDECMKVVIAGDEYL